MMEIQILADEKNILDVSLDNQTVAELLRVYLNMDSKVKIAVWKKEHYSRPLKLHIETAGKDAKKALVDAIDLVKKDLKKYSDEYSKAK